MAWYAVPPGKSAPLPLVIYLHGGFAFGSEDFDDARPFLGSGFAVLTPTFRGENGNPGYFEMFLGEVDDVLASVKWARTQPEIDPSRIYVFGHSTGGALAALACLRADGGIRAGGAASGLYGREFFDQTADIAPFRIANDELRRRRLFLPRAAELKVPFIFYLETDGFSQTTVRQLERLAALDKVPLNATLIEGDHFSMLPKAVSAFIVQLQTGWTR